MLMVQLLLTHKAQLTENVDNRSPLLIACIRGNDDTVKALLENNAAKKLVNKPDFCQFTPLMAAAKYGTPKMITLLLEKGARLEAKDENRNTCMTPRTRA